MIREIEIDAICFQQALESIKQFRSGEVYMQLGESDLEDLIEAYVLEWNKQFRIATGKAPKWKAK